MGSASSSSTTSSSSCQVSRYALGLFFILLVSLIWSAASILVQYLYDGMSFDSPFMLTYIGTSLFVLLLPSRLLWERRTATNLCSGSGCCSSSDHHRHTQQQQHHHDNIVVIPWSHHNNHYHHHHLTGGSISSSAGYTPVQHDVATSSQPQNHPIATRQHHYQDHVDDSSAISPQIGGSVQLVPNHHDMNNCYRSTIHRQDESMIDQTLQQQQHHHHHDPSLLLSHEDHIRIALKIAPVWFIANWSYNASLAFTSISSSTVLASTSSLFTFLIAVLCRDEDFSTLKLFGVVLGVCGSILTGWHDLEQPNDDRNSNSGGGGGGDNHQLNGTTPMHRFLETLLLLPDSSSSNNTPLPSAKWLVLGDFLSLLSAVGYAVQVILIRILCPRDEHNMSMQLLLGYVGLINALMFSPIAFYQVIYGTNTTTNQLTWTIFGCLVVKGLLDNVLSDYLWARAVVLTTATVATVGLGLTIPLAFLSDWMLGHAQVASVSSMIGALAILIGFVLVNVGNHTDNEEETHQHDVIDDIDYGQEHPSIHRLEERGDEDTTTATTADPVPTTAPSYDCS